LTKQPTKRLPRSYLPSQWLELTILLSLRTQWSNLFSMIRLPRSFFPRNDGNLNNSNVIANIVKQSHIQGTDCHGRKLPRNDGSLNNSNVIANVVKQSLIQW